MEYDKLLRQRDFLWLTVGTAISTLGDQAGWIALLWLVMSTESSPAQMGWAALCYGLPSVIASVAAGMLLDRLSRRKLMVLDNAVQGLLFLLIPALHHWHVLPFWLLCVMLICAGLLNPITSVGAMALTPELVPAHLLSQANALDEVLWQGAYLAGPLLGGGLVSLAGPSLAILIDGASFWACALCLLLIREGYGKAPVFTRTEVVHRPLVSLYAGLCALVSRRVVLAITFVALLLNLAYGQLDVSLPLLVHHELNRGGAALGILWTVYALGSILGTALVAGGTSTGRRGRRMAAMVAGLGISLVPMISVSGFSGAVVCMCAAGFCFGPYAPMARTVVQQQVPHDLRGRVLGIRTAIIGAGVPLGSWIAGIVAQFVNSSLWLGVTGLFIVLVAAAMWAYGPLRKLE